MLIPPSYHLNTADLASQAKEKPKRYTTSYLPNPESQNHNQNSPLAFPPLQNIKGKKRTLFLQLTFTTSHMFLYVFLTSLNCTYVFPFQIKRFGLSVGVTYGISKRLDLFEVSWFWIWILGSPRESRIFWSRPVQEVVGH